MKKRLRKELTKKGLLDAVHGCFEEIDDTVSGHGFTLADYLMSGFAVFSLKYPSLLEFDKSVHDEQNPVFHNLRKLYGVSDVPSDSAMRKRLDELSPRTLRGAFRKLFARLQRGKVLEEYKYIDGHVLLEFVPDTS